MFVVSMFSLKCLQLDFTGIDFADCTRAVSIEKRACLRKDETALAPVRSFDGEKKTQQVRPNIDNYNYN